MLPDKNKTRGQQEKDGSDSEERRIKTDDERRVLERSPWQI